MEFIKFKLNLAALFAICLLLFSACDFFGDDETQPVIVWTEFERRVFELTNVERVNHGLSPLLWHDNLAVAARGHSKDLMDNNMTGHVGSDGSTVGQRIERAGVTNMRRWAENCAYGYRTPEDVVAAWMGSSGHRANILNANLTHLGVGVFMRPEGSSARYISYWTQVFCAFF